MKNIIFLFFLFSLSLAAQSLPVAGKTYLLKYDPAGKNIFTKDSKIILVYTFDYWGTKGTSSEGPESLFQNVIKPDKGRKKEINMSPLNGIFTAEINIPDSAELLSYYLTDGNNSDFNDKKTYTSYVYNNSGKPVKGARFRNIDFLIMAGADNKTCIDEIENELKDYPDFHIARYVFWEKKFSGEKDFEKLLLLYNDFEKEFNQLKERFPDDYEFLNAQGKGYVAFQSALSGVLMPYYESASKRIIEIAEQIPDGKRASIIQRMYDMNQRQKKSAEFNKEIIGKPSIDFQFISTKGEKRMLSDFKGKVVLLDFWGTWCGPCLSEIPNLVKAYEKFKEKGFEIISISSDLMFNSKNEDEFKKFTEENNMSWTQALDDKDQTIHKLYNIVHWPTLYLIDKNGTIIRDENVLRGTQLEETLAEVFK